MRAGGRPAAIGPWRPRPLPLPASRARWRGHVGSSVPCRRRALAAASAGTLSVHVKLAAAAPSVRSFLIGSLDHAWVVVGGGGRKAGTSLHCTQRRQRTRWWEIASLAPRICVGFRRLGSRLAPTQHKHTCRGRGGMCTRKRPGPCMCPTCCHASPLVHEHAHHMAVTRAATPPHPTTTTLGMQHR